MRHFILVLVFTCAFCVSVNADVVIGPGSGLMSKPVGICNWHTNPACNFHFSITNTSSNVDIYRIEFTIAGLSAINVRITPGNLSQFAVPMPPGITSEMLVNATRIYTVGGKTGPPTNKNQCKNDGWRLFNFPRTFKNQGDCIRYLKTGQ